MRAIKLQMDNVKENIALNNKDKNQKRINTYEINSNKSVLPYIHVYLTVEMPKFTYIHYSRFQSNDIECLWKTI